MTTSHNHTRKLVISALFMALGFILPFFTGQIQQFGSMLCPMHFPIILCGFICGPVWGFAVGFLTPILRGLIFGMPSFPLMAIPMAFELCTYGLVAGLLYQVLKKNLTCTYIALVSAMIAGRLVWGIVRFLMIGATGTEFSLSIWLAGTVFSSIPGIILQLILIPIIITALQKSGRLN